MGLRGHPAPRSEGRSFCDHAAAPGALRALSAWHNDTFVSGPSWSEFTKEMGIGDSAASGMVYILGVHSPSLVIGSSS